MILKKPTKQAKKSRASSYSDQQEEETGDAILIVLHADMRDKDGPRGPEDSEVGATAAIPPNQSDFAIFSRMKGKQREEKKSDPQEGGTGDMIPIALPLDRGDEGKAGSQEDNEVGAKAAILQNQSDFAIFAKKE